jgi:hypothetical protein
MSNQLHLNAFLMGVGHHEAAWRHPRTEARNVLWVGHFQELARIAERGSAVGAGTPAARAGRFLDQR